MAIALALIDPETYWPNCMHKKPVHNKQEPCVSESDGSKQGRESVDISGTRSIKKIQSSTVNNNTLCPCTVVLCNHLAINRGAHLPKHPNNNQMHFALHMWGQQNASVGTYSLLCHMQCAFVC